MGLYAYEPRRPLTVDDVLRMVEVGIITADDRVELLDGELVEMTPQGPEHASATALLVELLQDVYGRRFVREEKPLRVGSTSLPEPDAVVTRQPVGDYFRRHPAGDETVLVVEVAATSQRRDTDKAAAYATSGVPEYWIVDLATREVTIHRGPRPDGTWTQVSRHDASAPLALPEVERTLRATDFLPPA